jgi:phenylalanyl-tRNA synthetase beta chain
VTETPVLERNRFELDFQVLNRALGMTLSKDHIEKSLIKMGYTIEAIEDTKAIVITPPIRTDVLHPCDIAEDIGIAFGYNNIKPQIPPTQTVGKPQPLNRFTDLLRSEIAQAGFIECLTMGLLSKKENFTNLREEIQPAVCLSNPLTIDLEIVRTTLIPGLLKCI